MKPVRITGPLPPMCDYCVQPAVLTCDWLYYCQRCWDRRRLVKESKR
jgi:hypothetical protein